MHDTISGCRSRFFRPLTMPMTGFGLISESSANHSEIGPQANNFVAGEQRHFQPLRHSTSAATPPREMKYFPSLLAERRNFPHIYDTVSSLSEKPGNTSAPPQTTTATNSETSCYGRNTRGTCTPGSERTSLTRSATSRQNEPTHRAGANETPWPVSTSRSPSWKPTDGCQIKCACGSPRTGRCEKEPTGKRANARCTASCSTGRMRTEPAGNGQSGQLPDGHTAFRGGK